MCQISIYVFSLQHHQNKLRSGTNGHFPSFLRLLRIKIINLLLLKGPQYKSTPFIFNFQNERSFYWVANQFFVSPEKLAQLPLCRFENLLPQGRQLILSYIVLFRLKFLSLTTLFSDHVLLRLVKYYGNSSGVTAISGKYQDVGCATFSGSNECHLRCAICGYVVHLLFSLQVYTKMVPSCWISIQGMFYLHLYCEAMQGNNIIFKFIF